MKLLSVIVKNIPLTMAVACLVLFKLLVATSVAFLAFSMAFSEASRAFLVSLVAFLIPSARFLYKYTHRM